MPNVTPSIHIVAEPSGQPERMGEMFQPTEITVDIRVDYTTVVAQAQKYNLGAVLNDMRAQSWQIWQGREFMVGAVDKGFIPSPLVPYRSYFSASLNAGEMAADGFHCRSISGRIVPGTKVIWHITVRLSGVGYQNLYERPHATVITTSSVRSVAAYRAGPDINFIQDANSSPKLGTPTQNSVFGSCTNSNARTGTYDQDNWVTYTKSTMDVNGEEVDINGQPITMPIEQINYTLQFVLRRPYYDGTIPGGPASPSGPGSRTVECLWELWGQYPEWCLNKRNAEAMFGYTAGQLVCTAVNNTPIDEEYMLCSVTLTWDEWGMCEQAPWGFEGTIPPKDENTAASGSPDRPILNADTIYWVNPVQECFNWSAFDFPDGAHALFSEMILNPG